MSAIWNLWWNHLGLRKLGLDLLSHAACTVVQQPLLWASAVLCLALPQQTFHYFSFSIYGVSSATQAFVSVWLVCCWCCFQTRILCPDYFGTHFVGQAVLELTEALPFSFWVLLGLKAFIIIPGLGITFVTSQSSLRTCWDFGPELSGPTATWKGKAFILFTLHVNSPSGQETGGRSWSRGGGEVLLIGLFLMTFSACFLSHKVPSQGGPTHSGLTPPVSITN